MNAKTKLAILALTALVANSVFAEAKMTAKEILKKTEEVYANCKSYKDSGYVRTVFLNKDGTTRFITKKEFKTSFIRPDKFRFEYAEKQADVLQNKYIIWKDGKNIKAFWEIKGEWIPESLSMAIAGATGVSSGTAHTIPSLLFAEVGGRLITKMKKPTLLSEKKDGNGIMCYLIKADNNDVIWIQKGVFLISKIEESKEFDDFKTKDVTVYHPQVNIKIPESDFAFKE